MYHEKQHLAHCAVHAVNNLFQQEWITYSDFAKIAQKLHQLDMNNGISGSFSFNPYKSIVPFLGNFDVQCLAEALKFKKCRISEHIVIASRISEKTLRVKDSSTVGYIINKEIPRWFGLRSSNHWFTVLPQDQEFVNLDSELSLPETFASESEFIVACINGTLNLKWQIFVISTDEVGPQQT